MSSLQGGALEEELFNARAKNTYLEQKLFDLRTKASAAGEEGLRNDHQPRGTHEAAGRATQAWRDAARSFPPPSVK